MVLDNLIAKKKLNRIALEIAERNSGKNHLVLAGVNGSGMVIATQLGEILKDLFPGKLSIVTVNIDKKNPQKASLENLPQIAHPTVLLIDDVANSGRTMLYALRPVIELDPESIQTVALLERSYKLFPVSIDYVGSSISTLPHEYIEVVIEKGEIAGAHVRE